MDRITIERIYLSTNEQSNAINAAADKDVKRDDMAEFYRDCLIADNIARQRNNTRVDFKAVNLAIIKRWPRGLKYIKEKAWKLLEAMR